MTESQNDRMTGSFADDWLYGIFTGTDLRDVEPPDIQSSASAGGPRHPQQCNLQETESGIRYSDDEGNSQICRKDLIRGFAKCLECEDTKNPSAYVNNLMEVWWQWIQNISNRYFKDSKDLIR